MGWREAADIDAFIANPRYPGSVVIVHAHESHPMIVRTALEAGADHSVAPSIPFRKIIARVRAVIRIRFRDTGRGERARTLSSR
jgi:DNA-binding response OmpR family regulator